MNADDVLETCIKNAKRWADMPTHSLRRMAAEVFEDDKLKDFYPYSKGELIAFLLEHYLDW